MITESSESLGKGYGDDPFPIWRVQLLQKRRDILSKKIIILCSTKWNKFDLWEESMVPKIGPNPFPRTMCATLFYPANCGTNYFRPTAFHPTLHNTIITKMSSSQMSNYPEVAPTCVATCLVVPCYLVNQGGHKHPYYLWQFVQFLLTTLR